MTFLWISRCGIQYLFMGRDAIFRACAGRKRNRSRKCGKVSTKSVERSIYARSPTTVAPRKRIAEYSAAAQSLQRILLCYILTPLLMCRRGFNSRVFKLSGLPYLRPECDCGLVGAYIHKGCNGSPHLHAPFFHNHE